MTHLPTITGDRAVDRVSWELWTDQEQARVGLPSLPHRMLFRPQGRVSMQASPSILISKEPYQDRVPHLGLESQHDRVDLQASSSVLLCFGLFPVSFRSWERMSVAGQVSSSKARLAVGD